jgi:CHAT domain-containing protein
MKFTNPDSKKVLETFNVLIKLSSSEEMVKFVTKNRFLLNNFTDKLITAHIDTIRSKGDSNQAQQFEFYRDWIEQLKQKIEQDNLQLDFIVFLNDIEKAEDALENYLRSNEIKYVNKAVLVWETIINHPDFSISEQSFRMGIFSDAGYSYWQRYNAKGDSGDLNTAILYCEMAVKYTHLNSPDLPNYLNILGNILRDKFYDSNNYKYLEKSIEVYEQAIRLSPSNSPELSDFLTNLGNGFNDRYDYIGDSRDLYKAIEYYEQALKNPSTSPTSSEEALYLNNLGNGLNNIYACKGNIDDLLRSIKANDKAVRLTPKSSPYLPGHLNNLGVGFLDYYKHNGNLNNLQKAIEAFEKAIDMVDENSPDLTLYLSNLGNALHEKYELTDNFDDLQKAITALEKSVNKTPKTSRNRSLYLGELGTGLCSLYACKGNLDHLHNAIQHCEEAVRLTKSEAPDLPYYLNKLSVGFREYYKHTKEPKYQEEATKNFLHAAKLGLKIAVEEGLKSTINWLPWAFTRESWQEVEQAYYYAYQTSERLFQIQLLREHKETWLKETQGVAAQAAYALTKLALNEKSPEATQKKLFNAAVILEQGLARLLSEALALNRADLTALQDTEHAHLYNDYQTIVERWEWAQQHNSDEIKLARENLDKVIDAIRQIKGYENFLMPSGNEEIQAATTINSLVYIVTTKTGGLALIADKTEIKPIWLANLIENTLQEKLHDYLIAYKNRQKNQIKWEETLIDITDWLWQTAMYPIINALPPQSKVTLIPVGLLGLLPLHAAWTHDNTCKTGKRYALDELTIRYTPNARALKEANTLAQQVNADKLLAIDNPSNDLATSDPEVQSVQAMFTDSKVLSQENATQEAVLNALPDYNVVHFSCHGQTNFQQPLQSGLLMANGQEITLKELLKKHLKVRLATLSACETGLSGTTLPDEVVSLSSGMLQAGVAGVVASLWSVSEISTMMLMTRFYGLWQQKQLDPVDALQQAQQWVRDTTKQEKMVYFRQTIKGLSPDSNEVHLPKQTAKWLYYAIKDSTQDFSHPYHWAAFTYVGV